MSVLSLMCLWLFCSCYLHHKTTVKAFFILSSHSTPPPTRSTVRRESITSETDVTTNSVTNVKSQLVTFSKYHGLGNDFILIDNREQTKPSLTPFEAARLCNRNMGVGADGVIFVLKPPDQSFDYSMRIFNSDGSEPEMCGNGIRCMAQFLNDLGGTGSTQAEVSTSFRIHTLAGPIVPVINRADNLITVDMGEPILQASLIPTTLSSNAPHNAVIDQTYITNGKEWKITTVSMGNPHAVIFVQDLADINLHLDGPILENSNVFPAKTNVEFVQVLSPTHLKMKVWERGAGPTLACGTGACALTVAAILAQKIPRPTNVDDQVRVTLPGGDLLIEWRVEDNKVYMTGPAAFVYQGTARL